MSALPVFPAQGPWFAVWCGKFWDIQISSGLYAHSFATVHINPYIGMSAEDASSAARLIAAAPDLLAALKECLDAEERRAKKLLPGAPASTYCVARLDRIRAAIAKAREASK